jgi:ketosteroid isomerase-like protein
MDTDDCIRIVEGVVMTRTEQHYATFAHRVSAAANSHDVEQVVACFTDDYLNEAPAHPSRGFRGREQVRRNWTSIFASVPDIVTTVVRADQVDDQVWSEWEMRGTRVDGGEHLMRGVMRFTLRGDQASAVRFYLEPVDADAQSADAALQRLLTGPRP